LALQKKLLRVLQDGEFERLGSSRARSTDVRVIAATNRNLEEEVNKGRFRKDLWYRINRFPLSIPPLKDRADDIPLLVNWIIKKSQRRLGKNIKTIPNNVMNDLKSYSWPGNVRELENVIERAVIITRGNMLQLAAPLKGPESDGGIPYDTPMKTLSEMERDYILQALRKTDWNISGKNGTAELLGLNSSTLRGRMRKHGIRRSSFNS
jgi:chemotaxis protein methyltransferase CheR